MNGHNNTEIQTFVRYTAAVVEQLDFSHSGPSLYESTFVVLDCETTGLSSSTDAITELCAIKVCGGEIIGEFHSLVNPKQKMSARIVAMTQITNEELLECPTIDQLIPSFLEFIQDNIIVGHNVSFDLSFLNAALERNDYPPLSNMYFDTLSLAKKLIPKEVPNFKLATLARYAGSKSIPTHRAYMDVRATIEVFHYLIERSSFLGIRGIYDLRQVPSVNTRKRFSKRNLAEKAPRVPGVYMFISKENEILYVGMSRNIKQRLSSYFTTDNRKRIDEMLSRSNSIEYITTPTAMEASVMELRLLSKLKPRYNVTDTFSKMSHLVIADINEPAPTFRVTGSKYTSNHVVFGPFTSRKTAEMFCGAINTSLGLRTCNSVCTPNSKHIQSECINSLRGLHSCFCYGKWDDVNKYTSNFHEMLEKFVSDHTLITRQVLQQMKILSDALQFEKAKIKHDQAVCIQKWMDRFILIDTAHTHRENETKEIPQIYFGRPIVRFTPKQSSLTTQISSQILTSDNENILKNIPSDSQTYNGTYICEPSEFRERYYTALFLARNNRFTTAVDSSKQTTVAIDQSATSATTIL